MLLLGESGVMLSHRLMARAPLVGFAKTAQSTSVLVLRSSAHVASRKWWLSRDVHDDGKRYIIPNDMTPRERPNSGYTMQVLSIISQLVVLQKKAEEYPSTRAVTVVGQ